MVRTYGRGEADSEVEDVRIQRQQDYRYLSSSFLSIDTKYLHRCSAFLIGRDERVCDWLMLHESISKQHAVIQYRKVPLVGAWIALHA